MTYPPRSVFTLLGSRRSFVQVFLIPFIVFPPFFRTDSKWAHYVVSLFPIIYNPNFPFPSPCGSLLPDDATPALLML